MLEGMHGLLALTLAASLAPGSLIPRGKHEAVIAAWNIAPDPIEDKLDRLVRSIRAMAPAVIALVEVTPLSGADVLLKGLAKQGASYTKSYAEKRERQNIVLLAKKGVTVTNVRGIPGSNLGIDRLRMAYCADVRVGKFDFILVAVHLKSKLTDAEFPNTVATRNRQAAAISDYLRKRTAGKEKDVLIVGDYNMVPGEDDVTFRTLNVYGELRFIAQPSQTNPFTFIFKDGKRTSFIDNFAISRRFTTEWVPNSFVVPRLDKMFGEGMLWYRDLVSDHLPVAARFRTDRDDD